MHLFNIELKMNVPNALSLFRIALLPFCLSLPERRPEPNIFASGVRSVYTFRHIRLARRDYRKEVQPDNRFGEDTRPACR